MKSVFMFRRDLRLQDNTGLYYALQESDLVIPVFIFTPQQIDNNEYKGDHSFEFLLNSLEDLDKQLREKGSQLYVFYGNPVSVLENLSFDTLYFNNDYTPFALSRDDELKQNFNVKSYDDLLINPPQSVFKKDGSPYTIFTPYYNRAKSIEVSKPNYQNFTNFFSESIKSITTLEEIRAQYLFSTNPDLAVKGGREEGLELLNQIYSKLDNYESTRDLPYCSGVSKLSAHNKFGTISPREFYYYVKGCEALTRQLYWRDFFTQIAYFYPHVFGNNFNSKFDYVKWDYDSEKFKAWCSGHTGFPIVDAGMRELNTTGYMHNRVRMIVASFLTKDLHIDWRLGEKYFAQQLVDYDPCVNNASWQWAASTGCDAQPYFRIFNPWRQQIRFDPNCEYIKKWVPELQQLSSQAIHKLNEQRPLVEIGYPKPIVDHNREKDEALRRFRGES